jgi:hypothetical protein
VIRESQRATMNELMIMIMHAWFRLMLIRQKLYYPNQFQNRRSLLRGRTVGITERQIFPFQALAYRDFMDVGC